jgi:hypothetical protein
MALKFAVGLLSLTLPELVAGAKWYASPPLREIEAKVSRNLRLDVQSLVKCANTWDPKAAKNAGFAKRDTDPELLYPAYNISVPIDYFHNDSLYEPHSNGTFNLRYWFDASYYKEGGPVIVLSGGETSGDDRLSFLQKGILHQLAQATNGIGVVLEHRYYGESWPVPDLTVENLRFLTTDQALADTAYFAKNVVFPGLEDKTLTAPTTPYIAYGGSYAGAFVAILRVLYPDVYFGAISSSGVVEAIVSR